MKIALWIYLVLSTLGLFRVLYEIMDCMVSYKYETVDEYGHLDSKLLWLLIFTIYILISIIIAIIVLIKLRKRKSRNIIVQGF
jgi:hypothetical protein